MFLAVHALGLDNELEERQRPRWHVERRPAGLQKIATVDAEPRNLVAIEMINLLVRHFGDEFKHAAINAHLFDIPLSFPGVFGGFDLVV